MLLGGGQVLAQSGGLGPTAPPMAAQRYEIGVRLYTDGRYADAAREFRVAQELMPDSPQLAFNIARCLERSGEVQSAYDAYGRYLELETDPAERAEVERVRAGLRRTLAERRAEQAAKPVAEPLGAVAPVEGGDWRPMAGWTALGVGVAGLVVGAVFHSAAAETADAGAALGPGRQDTADSLQSDLETEQALMFVGYGVGAALVATGAAILAWPTDGDVALGPTGRGAAVRWRVRF